MKKNTSKKLFNYAAISAAIFGTANAAGQIIYTDIDDVTLDTAGAFLQIDFDNDGTLDVNVGLLNFTGGPGAVANGSDGTSFNGNGIVGVPASGFYYPSNLAAGELIGGASPIIIGERGDMYVYACYPNSQWCGGVDDGYLGAAFDVSGSTHYGWIRLDVDSNGSGGVGTMVIKDFAYESTPDTDINAGDGSLGVNDNTFNNFEYFVDTNSKLNLSASTSMEKVALFNILGQEVLSQKLSNTTENVNLSSLKTGVYIATVTIDGNSKTFKIVKK